MKPVLLYTSIVLTIIVAFSCTKLSLNKSTTTTTDNSISEFLFNDNQIYIDSIFGIICTQGDNFSKTNNFAIFVATS